MAKMNGSIFAACVAIIGLLASPSMSAESYETRHYGVGNKVETFVFQPAGPRNGKAILLLHASSGLREGDLRYSEQLKAEGFVMVVPAFMKRYGITERARKTTWQTYGRDIYADFLAEIEQSSKDFDIPKDRFDAVGFSNGGHWAALLAARGDVHAGVSYYGAFTEAGTNTSLSTFRSAFTAKSSPWLILHGNNDQTVAVRYAEELLSMVQRSGSKVEAHFLKDVGHSFERTQLDNPSNVEAAKTAYTLTLKFLAEN